MRGDEQVSPGELGRVAAVNALLIGIREALTMDSHAMRHSPPATALPRWLVVGFVSGFLAVLVFHQGAAALLYALQWTPRAPYSMEAVAPLGIPQVLSLAFWGGVWGVLLAAILAWLDGAKLVVAATIFGAILPTLIAWFVVAPLKGQPPAGGFAMPGLLIGPIVNAAWGLGTGLGLLWFRRPRAGSATQTP
jgi:hypothetical protein